MAALSTATGGQLHKYIEYIVERIEGSMTRNESVDAAISPGVFNVKDNESNRNAIEEFVKNARKKSKQGDDAARDVRLEVDGNKPVRSPGFINFGQLEKPPGKPSRGDIGEAVIAAAICARFVYKHGVVTPQMVMGIMKTLGNKGIKNYPGKKGKFVENTFKSKNEGVKILDDVYCYISLNESAITASLRPRSQYGGWAYGDNTCIPAYARSACAYVNTGKVSQWAETVYTNMRYDKIEIKSDGLGDQKGTKVDTRVTITDQEGNPQPVNINLSMKVDDVKQFGQVSGMTFQVQQELWKRLFGYTSQVNRLKVKWDELSQEKNDLPGALNHVYDEVFKQVDSDMKGTNRDELIRNISEGITYFATRHEEHVELLNLGRGGTKLYKFDDFYQALTDLEDLKVTMKTQKNNLRQMNIEGKINNRFKTLISIRIRRQPESSKGAIEYIRNLIEKSSLMGDILAESL